MNCYEEFSNVIWPDAARYYTSCISSYRLIRLLHMRQILDKMLGMQQELPSGGQEREKQGKRKINALICKDKQLTNENLQNKG